MHYTVIIYLLICVLVGMSARDRFIGFWGGFLLAVIFTPLAVAILLLLSSPRSKK